LPSAGRNKPCTQPPGAGHQIHAKLTLPAKVVLQPEAATGAERLIRRTG
jgi:hypothetical protein